MFVTPHCKERVVRRLQGIVSLAEVRTAVSKLNPQVGETWVLVKRLPAHKVVTCNTPDGVVNGDLVWAVVKCRHEADAGKVVTVMLRRSGQKVKADHVVE